ncbi:hypothetical protein T45_04515 [Streptomyces turgidiscabies]|nr:hypothetical protein T45_04515 [Streptomyces turgidiscabies]
MVARWSFASWGASRPASVMYSWLRRPARRREPFPDLTDRHTPKPVDRQAQFRFSQNSLSFLSGSDTMRHLASSHIVARSVSV